MVLVFILLGLIILVLFILCLVMFSTLKIEVEKLELTNYEIQSKLEYRVVLSLYFLNKIRWIKTCFNEQKVKEIIKKMPIQIDIKKVEQKLKLQDLKVLKKLQLKISKFYLQSKLGVKSPVLTSFLVATLSSAISILLGKTATSLEKRKYQYEIVPIYQNKNLYKISFNCIIELKMVHIINVIYILIKKGKSDENERTASNRKSYGYSYE
ncbi:MAG: hypothetical protein HFJ28_01350 [Clostridia bacterium]|nr:hypothetical protein [Clostridia bacterium]